VRVPGTIGFDQGHVAVVRLLAAARIVRLLVQPDDTVHAGQPLATLEIPSLVKAQEELATARASVQEAEAAVEVAKDP
jgi:multidrug efflux pump subunit AcrA (membrane-fusion protein)